MAVGLKPGSVDDFPDSMAQAMELAFQSEWAAAKGEPLLPVGEEDRRILFAAIAQGVVKHFEAKANEAFQITVRVTQRPDVLIKSDNPAQIAVAGGGAIGAHQADVEQLGDTGNMMVAEGQSTNVEILTDY